MRIGGAQLMIPERIHITGRGDVRVRDIPTRGDANKPK